MAKTQVTDTSPTTAQLAQINRVATVARFVSSLAHELNNSLQVMSGLVELLAERDDLPPDVLLRLERIGSQADRARDKIRQVVGYVRQPAHPAERLDLADVVEHATALRSYELGRGGVSVAWERPVQPTWVRGSTRDLEQVVLNLLANAQEALAGAAQREIRIGLARHRAAAQLSVSDSGPGVPQSDRGRIFEPFFTTHAESGALGLGLTVAAQIADAHGGRLSLGGDAPGATFVLTLPEDPSPAPW